MVKSLTLQVQSGSSWKTITVDEAIERGTPHGRCVECQEPVRAHRQSVNGMAAHVEHITNIGDVR
jgi:hypothetical protein